MYLQLFPFCDEITQIDRVLRIYDPRFNYANIPLNLANTYGQVYASHMEPLTEGGRCLDAMCLVVGNVPSIAAVFVQQLGIYEHVDGTLTKLLHPAG